MLHIGKVNVFPDGFVGNSTACLVPAARPLKEFHLLSLMGGKKPSHR